MHCWHEYICTGYLRIIDWLSNKTNLSKWFIPSGKLSSLKRKSLLPFEAFFLFIFFINAKVIYIVKMAEHLKAVSSLLKFRLSQHNANFTFYFIVTISKYPFRGLHGRTPIPSFLHTMNSSNSGCRSRRLYCCWKKKVTDYQRLYRWVSYFSNKRKQYILPSSSIISVKFSLIHSGFFYLNLWLHYQWANVNLSISKPQTMETVLATRLQIFFVLSSAEHEICPAESQLSINSKFFLNQHSWKWTFLC